MKKYVLIDRLRNTQRLQAEVSPTWVVTQRFLPIEDKRCVTTELTAEKETKY